MINKPIKSFSATLLTTEKDWQGSSIWLCTFHILKYSDHQWDILTIWRTGSLQTHWSVQLVCMYESSGSQSFRTTTGIQSGPDAFCKSSLVTNFLINLEVTEICSIYGILEYCQNIRILKSNMGVTEVVCSLNRNSSCFSLYFFILNF